MNEIWVLGATGRSGRAIAAELVARHVSPVLVGHEATRLREPAEKIGGDSRIVVAGSVDAVIPELAKSKPAVVVDTIGPFAQTALPIGHPHRSPPPTSAMRHRAAGVGLMGDLQGACRVSLPSPQPVTWRRDRRPW
ncbi:hypothetical protein [Actinacidiphila oryziradicis]|uniref:hypothetical protein n=1 Tax=Actinacidiphila oryziradicis TaxID=2571141 RepID=UPI0023EF9F70|nr:hypothetical protein [Actinacidiphila oryziradicis]MCW2871425.1 Saccharopine dehydrogenase [Actinacidiphila oryziradicis]